MYCIAVPKRHSQKEKRMKWKNNTIIQNNEKKINKYMYRKYTLSLCVCECFFFRIVNFFPIVNTNTCIEHFSNFPPCCFFSPFSSSSALLLCARSSLSVFLCHMAARALLPNNYLNQFSLKLFLLPIALIRYGSYFFLFCVAWIAG